jgi:hypothetical protein
MWKIYSVPCDSTLNRFYCNNILKILHLVNDHYLVVAEIKERLAVSRQSMHGFHIGRFNLKKLNKVEGKEKCRVEGSNRFAALETLDVEVDISSAWGTIRENVKISAKEL